jgi:riboflavin kinase/FMN adenylyltransferase
MTDSAFHVFHSLEEAAGRFGPCALTIGNFDGVHAGHRRIMRRVVALARERGWRPAVLTFDPHPATVVAPERVPRLMTAPEQRALLMKQEGIEHVLILPFTRKVSELEPEEFVAEVLVRRLEARAVLIGENFRFGHRHAGDTALLEKLGAKYGFLTEVIPAVRLRGRVVSSSQVRLLLAEGNVALAGRMLESPFAVEGRVVAGHGIGSKITVPTLNLAAETGILPAPGVYVTYTRALGDGRAWPSVTNIGNRPTFGGDEALSVETHLLEPLEGEPPGAIHVEFLMRLRDERKFETPEALKQQILHDAARAREFFRRTCYPTP